MSGKKRLLMGLAAVALISVCMGPRPLIADEGDLAYGQTYGGEDPLLADDGEPEYIEADNEVDLRIAIFFAHDEAVAIRLTGDIVLAEPIKLGRGSDVTIDLNGYDLDGSSAEVDSGYNTGGGVFRVEEGATLHIIQLSPGRLARLVGGHAERGGAIYNKGTVHISGFVVAGCHAHDLGGAIYNEGSLTVEGCNFEDCSADQMGGAIYNKGSFSYSSGTVTDCRAQKGGGIATSSGMKLWDVTLSKNTATDCGGAILFDDFPVSQTYDIDASKIISNVAPKGAAFGENVRYDYFSKVNIRSGTIVEENESTNGPVIFLDGFDLYFNDAEVVRNKSADAGYGGASVWRTYYSNISGKVTIEGNVDFEGKPANVYPPSASLNRYIDVVGKLDEASRISVDARGYEGMITLEYDRYNASVPPATFFVVESGSVVLRDGEACLVRDASFVGMQYVDEQGEVRSVEDFLPYTGETTLEGGTYLLDSKRLGTGELRVEDPIRVSSHTRLIMGPDVTLEALQGIELEGEDSSLTIYAEPSGGGQLRCVGRPGLPGIGVASDATGQHAVGIYGVSVEATGGASAAGIGGNSSLDVVIGRGSTVHATGGEGGAGIGGNAGQSTRSISIGGATVDARGGTSEPATGAGIGSGKSGDLTCRITIEKGSTVRAYGSSQAAPVGGGQGASITPQASCAIHESDVSTFVEGAAPDANEWPAFGPGTGGTGTLNLTLGDDLCVGTAKAASGEPAYDLVPVQERISTCTAMGLGAEKEVRIRPCDHEQATYIYKDANFHTLSCPTCMAEQVEERHAWGQGDTCACGYRRGGWTVRYVSGTDTRTLGEVTGTLVLADAGLFQAPAGKAFDAWLVTMGDEKPFAAQPGERLALVADVTIEPLWRDLRGGSDDPRAGTDFVPGALRTLFVPYGAGWLPFSANTTQTETRSQREDGTTSTTTVADGNDARTGLALGEGLQAPAGSAGSYAAAAQTPASTTTGAQAALPATASGSVTPVASTGTGTPVAAKATPATADSALCAQAIAAVGSASAFAGLCLARRRRR